MKLPPGRHRTTASDNNLIPMINVVFLLLIFFMIAGHIRASDPLPLQVPESAQNLPATAARLTLYVASDGTLILDQHKITLATLAQSLAARLEVLPARTESNSVPTENKPPPPSDELPDTPWSQRRLAVKADAQVTVSLLRDVMRVIRQSGLQRVELLTTKTTLPAG